MDIIHPVSLKKEFGHEVVFWVGMDVQTVLPCLPEKEVGWRTGEIIYIMAPYMGSDPFNYL